MLTVAIPVKIGQALYPNKLFYISKGVMDYGSWCEVDQKGKKTGKLLTN